MSDRAAIDAQVVDIQNDRQHKGYIKVTLHVVDKAGPHLNEVLGSWPTYTDPVPVALARINIEAVEVAPKPPSDPLDKPQTGVRNPLQYRAIKLSENELFHRYLEKELGRETVDEDFATRYLRTWCGVEKRSHILPGTISAQLFGDLLDEFNRWNDTAKFVNA